MENQFIAPEEKRKISGPEKNLRPADGQSYCKITSERSSEKLNARARSAVKN
jgi:hypothetical protein